MPIPSFEKTTGEKFDIRIPFLNDDPTITYEVAEINSVTAKRQDTGADADSILDHGLQSMEDDTVGIWVQNGEDGVEYTITVRATMTSGQTLDRQAELLVTNTQSR